MTQNNDIRAIMMKQHLTKFFKIIIGGDYVYNSLQKQLHEMLSESRNLGFGNIESDVLAYLALLYNREGMVDSAIDSNRRSHEVSVINEYPAGVYRALNNLAIDYSRIGDFEESLATFKMALEICEANTDLTPRMITVCSNIGETLIELNRYSEARPLFERSMAIYNSLSAKNELNINEWGHISISHLGIAKADIEDNKYKIARQQVSIALETFTNSELVEYTLSAHFALIRIAFLDPETSESWQDALLRAEAVQNEQIARGTLFGDIAYVCLNEARYWLSKGERYLATRYAQTAKQLYVDIGDLHNQKRADQVLNKFQSN